MEISVGKRVFTFLMLVTLRAVSGNNDCPSTFPPKCFCNKQMTSVNCEGLDLISVPTGMPKSVERLYLRHNRFSTINSSDFGILPNLKELYLQNNKILKLQQYSFRGYNTPNLNILHLDNNDITTLEKWAFFNMTGLEQLFLGNNYINIIDEEAFFQCTSLTLIVLDSNKLTQIPPLGRVKSLVSMYIQANAITNATFPEGYINLTNLKDIGLSNNNIQSLENRTFEALRESNVLKLELSRNKINRISTGAFNPMLQIQSLKLGRNPITSPVLEHALVGLQGKPLRSLNIANLTLGGFLPNSTFLLLRNTTINTLLMSNNLISRVPDRAFADLENLQLLDLSSSGILSTADTAFDGLKTLTNLKLNDNLLTEVPRNLPSSLRLLYLNGNKINVLWDNVFGNLVSLSRLYLGSNKIVTLHEQAFIGLPNLHTLHLVQNNIGTLPGKLFQSLIGLTSLELNKNNIKSIPDEPYLFQDMQALQYLNLADNALEALPPTLLNPLSSLSYLHLENNNLGSAMAKDREGKLFAGLVKLQELYLSNNQIWRITDPSFRDMKSLQLLAVQQNRISGWGPHLFNNMVKLESLDLSHNLISLVNSTSVKDLHYLKTWNLTDNPFACTCDLRWFRDWMNQTSIVLLGNESYKCNSPDSWRGKKLLSFDRSKINCLFFTLPILIAIVGGAVIIVIFIIILAYRKRWFIRLRWHRLKRSLRGKVIGSKQYQPIPGDNRKYDAYVSCAEDDWRWVVDHLLPDIDQDNFNNKPFGGEFRLYFDERNSDPGKTYIANIVDNMEASRKVIVLLSNRYVSDARCEFELDLTIMSKAKREIEDFIIVIIEDVKASRIPKSLHHIIACRKFLQWENQEDAIKTFKGRLKEFLEERAEDYEPLAEV